MNGTGHGRPEGAGSIWGVPLEAALDALGQYVTPDDVQMVLEETGRCGQRRRRLPAPAVVWLPPRAKRINPRVVKRKMSHYLAGVIRGGGDAEDPLAARRGAKSGAADEISAGI